MRASPLRSTSIDSAEGEPQLLAAAMDGANALVEEGSEERSGGSAHIGKMLFSAGDTQLAIAAYCPAERLGQLDCAHWLAAVLAKLGGGQLGEGAGAAGASATVPKDEANGRFPLKLKEEGIAAAIAYLKERALFPETADDDDDEPCFGDDAFDSL